MKEKDYIEELIAKNLEELNNNEPPAGHFERFEARLQGLQAKRKTTVFSIVWKVAAAAVFAFLIVNQAIIWFYASYSSPLTQKGNQIKMASV